MTPRLCRLPRAFGAALAHSAAPSKAQGPSMLSIQNLTHVYPNGTRALDDVSLDIPAGMFGLLGPNGAGKSSLMRCLATLQVPTAGSIRFGEIDVLKSPEALRAT